VTVEYDLQMERHVLVNRDDRVGRIVLNRPERRNALSLELMRQLCAALRDVSANTDAIVVEGAGPVFSAGHDLSEMVGRPVDFYDELFAACTELMLTVHQVPQPVVAKVHGVATAAGCQLAAACDLVVAAEDARFATPGVKIGLFCSTPMVPLTRAIGRKRAMEMLLTGEPISADTALAWGLVNRLAAPADLEAATVALVAEITRFSPRVIATGKQAFYRQVDLAEVDAYEVTAPIMSCSAAAADAQEGIAAFLEKRPAVWRDGRPG
jgi:enoyl-CoA hydratase/carnithine racemase